MSLVVAVLGGVAPAPAVAAAPPKSFQLSVSKTGPTGFVGNGTVTSSPAGIDCGSDCSETYASQTKVTLSAVADAGSTFIGWGGACSGNASCVVTMKQATTVSASFASDGRIAVSIIPGGRDYSGDPTYSGKVTSAPAGIDCGDVCSADFRYGSSVTLSAAPIDPATTRFVGWSGCPSPSGSTCTISANGAPPTVYATFSMRILWTLTVTVPDISDGASGRIVSSPSGIDCQDGSTCSASFDSGTSVVLSPVSNDGTATLYSWGDACDGTAASSSCVVDGPDASVTATFGPTRYALNVTISGLGGSSGSVAAADGSLSCSSGTCSANYLANTTVSLTATEAEGSRFSGWSGACRSTTPTCVVSMTQIRNVTATFDRPQVLTVLKGGSMTGSVTSSPVGIDCAAECLSASATFAYGESVTLTAVASSDATFAGWSGASCGLQTTCVVRVTSTMSVTASFVPPSSTVTVSKRSVDGGTGSVASTPTGISCGPNSSCAPVVFATGSTVELRATPQKDSVFLGWEGDCTGTSTCVLTIDGPKNVTAVFARPTVTVTKVLVAGASGTVTSSPRGISCGTTCKATFSPNATVTLKAAAGTGSTFAGWTGACTGLGDCVVRADGTLSVQATFTPPPVTLTVSPATGGSVVAVSPTGGIDCGLLCTATYAYGTSVTLEARPDAGYAFSSWGGACATSLTATCTVSMTALRTVSVIFVAL